MLRFVGLLSLLVLVVVLVSCKSNDSSIKDDNDIATVVKTIPGFKFIKEETFTRYNMTNTVKSILQSFRFRKEETFTCGGQTNTVKIYLHKKTGLEFVLVPEGRIHPTDCLDRNQTYNIRPFLICRTEVTQAAWKKIIETAPWSNKINVKEGGEYPASYLSFGDCYSFCQKTGLHFPTQPLWEYACRAGATTEFCFGNSESDLCEYAWFKDNTMDVGENYAHRVGRKKPNAFGLYDMHGNNLEWCWSAPPPGLGAPSRAFRGGSWANLAKHCTSKFRHDYTMALPARAGTPLLLAPGIPPRHLRGFRPVCSLPIMPE